MADIFVSYKKENRAYAERFAKLFGEQGFSVWWDDDITPRRAWDETIEREISAALSVVVLWSPLAIQSDWVRNEAHYGHDRGKLVPVMVERCDLPLAFRLTQTVDLCGWDGDVSNRHWRKLLTWLADLKSAAANASGAAAPNPFRASVGQLASGEAIVDGTLVNNATPPGTLFRDSPEAPVMRILPPGEFLLGGMPDDPERLSVETPQKRITLSRPFALSVYPVTGAEFARHAPSPVAVAAAPSSGWFGSRKAVAAPVAKPASAPDVAVSGITFDDAATFVRALSASLSLPYRLPSEAEWEYACRAGSRGRYSWGEEIDASRALYRWPAATHSGPCSPGKFAPNGFGLYDMHGNVREWTEDLWHENYDQIPQDGRPATDGHGSMRVTRGGGWSDPAAMLRCSARGRATQTIRSDVIGMRVVRPL